MYPSISHLLYDLFGIDLPMPIQTFGFFVALAFVSANIVFAAEMKRKEREGLLSSWPIKVKRGKKLTPFDYAGSALLGLILGAKLGAAIMDYQALVDDPPGFLISLKGNWLFGVLGAAGMVYWRYRENQTELKKYPKPTEVVEQRHPYQEVGNMTIWAAVFGLSGAKLFHLLENPHEFATLFDSVDSFFAGLTIYGGLLVGGAAVIYYARKKKISIPHTIDSVAPGLMLAYGIGRIGCQLSGDGDWGIDNLAAKPGWLSWLPDWAWSYTYPHNVIREGVPMEGCDPAVWGEYCTQLANPAWPTPLYETTVSILLFLVMWALRKRISVPGMMFSLYLIFNGVERFFIEKVRINVKYHIGSLEITQAEIISVVLVILGIIGVWYFRKLHKNTPQNPPTPATDGA